MSSRDLRAARAARSARSTSPAKPRSSTLKNGTQAPPLQTRSLQAFQMSTDDLKSERTDREERQHTLPSVNRKKSPQASAESRKSAVDDFHYEYDYTRQGSVKIETVTPDDAINEDFERYRRDNLSQDSYRISDSRDSSVDRLEMRPKSADIEAEFIGAEPLDEAQLIQKLEHEQQLQESRNMEEENDDDLSKLPQNGDILRNDEEPAINEEVHIIQAEWDLPESCLQTEVEKVISIETTRIVETIETTRVTPVTETYLRQKRLSRENAVRVVDEDVSSSAAETEKCADDVVDVPGPEFAVPVSMSIDQDEMEMFSEEKVRSFIASLIDDAVKKTAEEMKAELNDEEIEVRKPAELNLAVTEERESPVEEVTAEDISRDEPLTSANGYDAPEAKIELEGSEKLELSGCNSEDTTESQITVVEVEADDTQQETVVICERLGKPLDMAAHLVYEEAAQQSLTDVTSPSAEVLETAELPTDTKTEDADICPDSVQPCFVADQQIEKTAAAAEMDVASETLETAANQTVSSAETERQETLPVDLAEIDQKTVAQSEDQVSDEVVELRKDAEREHAAETSDDISYLLHKRHIIPAVDKTAGDARHSLYATLPARHHTSRSRSLSPGHKKPATLTSEQKRAQMMKVKASLVSMAAEMAARGSPKSPVGTSAPTKRVLDFVVCSRLPPRDSFSSRDDTLSPPDECDITLVPREMKVSSTEKKPADESETKPSDLPEKADAEEAVCLEAESADDLTEKASGLEQFPPPVDSFSVEVMTQEDVSMNLNIIERTVTEKETTEVEKLETPESLESESESESKPVGDKAATPELEDEVNRILSDYELHVAAGEDIGSPASGMSGKFTDEGPDAEANHRELEGDLRTFLEPTEGAALSEDGGSIPPVMEHSEAAAESYEAHILPPPPCFATNSDVTESPPPEIKIKIRLPASLQTRESHELSGVHEYVNGVVTHPDDFEHYETDGIANDAAKLAAAEQRLLLQLQANDLAASADNASSSSRSLNDQLDAEVVHSFASVPPAVDAACRLSESSVDGQATCGFGRNVHLLDWLEEQAQLRGVSVSPHGADGHPDGNAISDEDDVEHAVFEDNLQDIFAALEAEVMANPFLVPVTPQTSDMCINALTSDRLSIEDDSSVGAFEASGGVIESTSGVDGQQEVLDEEPKHIGAVGIADADTNIRRSRVSLSISSEGEVVVEHLNDLSDPLEVLEIESRALPPQPRAMPVRWSSESDSLSNECDEEEKLQDVGDVLDRVDEGQRLNLSDLDDEERLLAVGARQVPLQSDTSSGSSAARVCVEEEADALAALEEADNLTSAGAVRAPHSNSDDGDDAHSASSSSAVDSDPAALGNFVEQVMLHHSGGSEILDACEEKTQPVAAAEGDIAGKQDTETADKDTAQTEYTLTPSCETGVVSQETEISKVSEMPQSAEAISDEDEVEKSIDDSLQDVFAALAADTAKRCSLPVIPQTSIMLDQDSSSDDREALREHKTAIEDPVSNDVTDDGVGAKDFGQETADTDVDRYVSPTSVSKSPEVAAREAHRSQSADGSESSTVELVRDADDLSELTLTAGTHCGQDSRTEVCRRDLAEYGVQDDRVQQETNRQDSEPTQIPPDSSFALKKSAEDEAERIVKTVISHATETLELDARSSQTIDVGDRSNENVTAETRSNDDVVASGVITGAANERMDVEVETAGGGAGCSNDRSEPCSSPQDAEDREVVTESTEQS